VSSISSLSQQPQKCECHECTQARWKSSIQGQIERALTPQPTAPPAPKNLTLKDH